MQPFSDSPVGRISGDWAAVQYVVALQSERVPLLSAIEAWEAGVPLEYASAIG